MNLYSSSILFGSNKLLILNIFLLFQYLLLVFFGNQLGYHFVFYLIIFIGPLVFENLSYLNSVMLILSSYFLVHFYEMNFKKKFIFNK